MGEESGWCIKVKGEGKWVEHEIIEDVENNVSEEWEEHESDIRGEWVEHENRMWMWKMTPKKNSV